MNCLPLQMVASFNWYNKFSSILQRRQFYVTSCLLSCKPNLSGKGSTLQGKNLLLGSKFFPFRVDPSEGKQNWFWPSCLHWKGIFLKIWTSSFGLRQMKSCKAKVQLSVCIHAVWLGPSLSTYEGHAKSSVTNRLPWFYPRYILKCFTALEWCVQ